jgi:ferredoxin
MFTRKIINRGDLINILKALSQRYILFVSVKGLEDYHFVKDFDLREIEFPSYRAVEPIKSFYLPAKEDLSQQDSKPIAIFGVKNCDLNSFKVLDYVYLEGDFKDPYYARRREEYFIFSSDCSGFKEVCFCTSLGYKPYPEEGYDLNLAQLSEDEYVLEVGSEKGEKFLQENKFEFKDLDSGKEELLRQVRQEIYTQVKENADKVLPQEFKDELRNALLQNLDSDIWESEAQKCVECGACTSICASCHCFLLATKPDSFDKLRLWDSCLLKSYAQVAGGANPRKKLLERLRNRFIKKFDFFPTLIGTFGCTGCGRCVEACLGNIDIRKVLRELTGAEVKE